MKDYEVILFDLDGTVIDQGLGIVNSVMYALEKFNISVDNPKELHKFIGPPLHKSFEEFYGFSEEQAMKAVEYYREYYKDKGIYQTEIYNGIEDVLKELKDNQKIIALSTSKPQFFSEKILDFLKLTSYFDVIVGSNLDGTRTDKAEIIEYTISQCNAIKAVDISKVIIVGDRKHDIIGAKTAGIDSLGVLYGYGSKEELDNVKPTYIASTPHNITEILLNK